MKVCVVDEVAREAYLHYRQLLDGSWMGEAICMYTGGSCSWCVMSWAVIKAGVQSVKGL
jgi:hypothetical protein